MTLWHMHSEILRGFYASEVYVAAENQQAAQNLAMEVFDRHIASMVEDFHCNFLTDAFPTDAEYPAELQELRQKFRLEIAQKLVELPFDAAIYHRV